MAPGDAAGTPAPAKTSASVTKARGRMAQRAAPGGSLILARASVTSAAVTWSPWLPQALRTYVRMLAISSSRSWLIGGMTELNCCPLTVTGPLSPLSTTSIDRCLFAMRKSDFASGGNTFGSPWPVGWWQTEQVPLKSDSPAAICVLTSSVPFSSALAADAMAVEEGPAFSLMYSTSTSLPEYTSLFSGPSTLSMPSAPLLKVRKMEWSTMMYVPGTSTLNSTMAEPPAGISVVCTFS